jgi:heme/copper-type cytochrome/quinol oxidase subunit 3
MAGADASESNPGEPVRTGEGAEGFPHGSKYPLFVGAGLFVIGLGLAWSPLFLVVGVPLELYGLAGWTREYAIEEYEAGVVPAQKRQLTGIESGLLGMYVLVVSEILVFAGFFVAFFYLDATRGPFPPAGFPAPQLSLGAAMAGIMLAGSLAAMYGRRAIGRGDRSGLVRGYAGTILAGLAFLALLGLEWRGLLAEGFSWVDGPYGASYYALTGLHAGHLVAGLVLVGIVVYRAVARDHFSEHRNLMVRTAEVYWHFLTAISLAILVFVYFGLN